jgi:hypothetical protein
MNKEGIRKCANPPSRVRGIYERVCEQSEPAKHKDHGKQQHCKGNRSALCCHAVRGTGDQAHAFVVQPVLNKQMSFLRIHLKKVKVWEPLHLEILELLFPKSLPVFASEARPTPKHRSQKANYRESPKRNDIFYSKERQENARAENKKVVGALPKKIHLEISGVDQYVVQLVWRNAPWPVG